ncbi:hypothetical protein QFC19_008737 [Naganishia cerealis]|uniref:Uncharacterized protein n=1 Tax=Naganishia cerealis TaxID=610337 RepID=A0ACC2UYZ3_9TREE|nr:hypothetical protein QFC19_008737 [Naganishia cerealis]
MVGFTESLDPSSPPPSALVQLPPIARALSPAEEAASAHHLFNDDQLQTRLLLSHYDSSVAGQGKLPPMSRINPEMVQRKPPPPLRFGLRSMGGSSSASGVSTPVRGGSNGARNRRRTSQGRETSSHRESGNNSRQSDGGPEVVFHPDRQNNDLTVDDRKALGAQRLDDQLAPGLTSSLIQSKQHSSDSDDDEEPQTESTVAASETAQGLLRWVYDNWYDFGWMIGRKSFDIGWSLLKYGVQGGPKKSWGIEMTLVAAIMRNLSAHSSLADITLVRNLISIHHLLPLPPDAIVTPITFKIRKRGKHEALRGFLSELDDMNTGNRELSGEWVVNKAVWARLKAKKKERDRQRMREREGRIRGQPSSKRSAPNAKTKEGEKIIYYIHGGKSPIVKPMLLTLANSLALLLSGAYYVGQAATHRLITIALSKACNARVFAPESRFPEPLLDVVYGYFRLIESLSIDPSNILVMGDSAGGGLSLALSMYLRDSGYQHLLPRGLVLMSPWVDLTMSCGSWDENAPYDVVPQPGQGDHLNPVACYLGPEGIKQYLTHPYASPLFGDFHDLPPMLIQAGDSEVLRDEITLLAHKATLAGVKVKHEMYVDQVHVFQSFPFQSAATVAFRSIAKFAASLRESPPRPRPEPLDDASARQPYSTLPSSSTSKDSAGRATTPTDIDNVASEMERGQTRLVKGDGTEIEIESSEEDVDGKVGSIPPPKSRQRATVPGNHDITASSNTNDSGNQPSKPMLHRAFPSFSRAKAPPGISTAFLFPVEGSTTTLPSLVDRKSPESPKSVSATSTMRGSRRSRRPTISMQLTLSPVKPTTRLRSQSHADMVQLVETYNQAGGANQTTVFTPASEMLPFDFPPATATAGKEGNGLQLNMAE